MTPLIVRVEDGEARRATEHAFSRSPVRVGRSARNDLCLTQPFVSAWHGLVEFDASGVRYTDLGSTNGTLLNDAPLEPRRPVPLDAGAALAIGALRLLVRRADEARRAAPSPDPTRGVPDPPTEADARAPDVAPEPRVAPGGLTAMMKKLAGVQTVDFERAWRQVLVPGAVIGRFELHREIGRGSFGVVFEAKDRQLGRLVAFKAVKPGRESQVMFREELLQKEAEAVAQLNHPNIVSLYDAGTCESGPYLIMELLHGETLRERLRRAGRLPLREAVEAAIQIAWALDHAHAAGVIHRDLKPANVFVCHSGQVKVLDFGIAHVFGAGARRAIGTPAYMAPEQWREGPQDARVDVFGAAATLAETLTGRLPYRTTGEWSAVLEPDARPHVSAPGAPPRLTALLRRALAPDPERRPRDGGAWLAALLEVNELLDDTPSLGVERANAAPPAAAPAPEPARRRATIAAVVAASVAAVTGFGALAWFLMH